ncbi:MAG: extracellular solute-binding protein [Deferribacteres bacterium]|nr:extracellular solute-binding protein [candidate division KSB1 bacterium]MCB9500926.1 extracellular solute-binding protein [Deferribacteres bacterium]
MRLIRNFVLVFSLFLLVTACNDNKTTLVVYTTHGKELVEEFVTDFEKKNPDVRVYSIDMGSQDALDRIRSEKANPQASVWWGAPAPLFMQAATESLLVAYQPTWSSAIDSAYRDEENFWYGTFLTPEVIAFNSEKLSKESAPQDWDDLLTPQWRDRIVIRSPLASGTMRAIFVSRITESLRRGGTVEEGFNWLQKLDENTHSYAADQTMLYIKLARGESEVTLWNMPDIMLQHNVNNYPFDYIMPKSGTVIVTDCIALVRGGQHQQLAQKFYEFVTSKDALIQQAHKYYRIPARHDIDMQSLPEWMREPIKAIPMDWKLFAEKSNEWMRYWDEQIRNRGK